MPHTFLTRRSFLAASASALGAGLKPAAAAANPLYRARTIVTGMRDETRIPGLRRCLPQVLVRVSGNPSLEAHPLMPEIAKTAEAFPSHVSYRDLYAFRPIRDEQGTRDRPYEMTVEYDVPAIDALLARFGAKPWVEDRPRLVIFLAVHHIGNEYVLSSTIDAGDLQREAFQDAAWRYGLEVVIPAERLLQQAGLDVASLPQAPLSTLQSLLDKSVGQRPLAGTLNWSRELLGWTSAWRLDHQGTEHRWGADGGNFDAAFRLAVGGAAQILSGNGTPD